MLMKIAGELRIVWEALCHDPARALALSLYLLAAICFIVALSISLPRAIAAYHAQRNEGDHGE